MEDELSEQRVVAWQAAYLDYRDIKAWIGSAYPFGCWTVLSDDISEELRGSIERPSPIHTPSPSSEHGVNLLGLRHHPQKSFDVWLVSLSEHPMPGLQPTEVVLRCHAEGALVTDDALILTIRRLDEHREPLSLLLDGEQCEARNVAFIEFQECRDLHGRLQSDNAALNRTRSAAEDNDVRSSFTATSQVATEFPRPSLSAYVRRLCEANDLLSAKIVSECNRVEDFYRRTTNGWSRELFRLVNLGNEILRAEHLPSLPLHSHRLSSAISPSFSAAPSLVQDASLRERKRRLNEALQRIYFAYILLLKFLQQNSRAVDHLLSKAEKRSQQSISLPFQEWLSQRYYFYCFPGNPRVHPVCSLLEFIEERVIELNSGQKKAAARMLHPVEESVVSRHRLLDASIVGVLFGISVGCVGLSFFNESFVTPTLSVTTFTPDTNQQTLLSNLLYLTGLVTLLAVLFAVNVVVWDFCGVQYAFIFELDQRRHAEGLAMLRMTMKYATVWSVGFFFQAQLRSVPALAQYTNLMSVGIVCAVAALALSDLLRDKAAGTLRTISHTIRSPLRRRMSVAAASASDSVAAEPHPGYGSHGSLLVRSPSGWLRKALLRIVAAPLFPVSFTDFYIADQLTSLTGIFGLIQSMASSVLLDDGASSSQWPVLACMPHVWRFLQCMRRWADGTSWSLLHPNVTNALKYTSGFLQIVTAWRFAEALKAANNDVSAVADALRLWGAFATVEFFYKCGWDLYMDAGVFMAPFSWKRTADNPHPLIRKTILYRERFYWAFCCANVLMRSCTLLRVYSLAHGLDLAHVNPVVWWTVEVCRRFFWNFFRVENEQVSNTEKYRAVDVLPPSWNDAEHVTLNAMDAQFAHLWSDSPVATLPPKRLVFERLPLHHKHVALCSLFSHRFEVEAASEVWRLTSPASLDVFLKLHDEDQVRVLFFAIGREPVASFLQRFPSSPPAAEVHPTPTVPKPTCPP